MAVLKRAAFVLATIIAGAVWLPAYIAVLILTLPGWVLTGEWLIVPFMEWTMDVLDDMAGWVIPDGKEACMSKYDEAR